MPHSLELFSRTNLRGRHRNRRAILAVVTLVACGLLGGGLAGAAAAPRSPNEPFFPHSGNPGYEVGHYGVDLGYRPRSGELTVRDVVEAHATSRLGRFSLDLAGLKVTSVSVDGEAAEYSRGGGAEFADKPYGKTPYNGRPGKVEIVPARPIQKGEPFTVELRYEGVPSGVGWFRTSDGAIVEGEPVGTAAWLACNNAPRDKASFDMAITVPAGLKAVSNGRLVSREKVGGRVRWSWSEPAPMATYLALVDIGHGKLVRGHIGRLPTWTLVEPRLAKKSRAAIDSLPEVIRFESHIFGPYPFAAAGSVVVGDANEELHFAGMETQTRPIYTDVPRRSTVVHETAHQWFGDSVGLDSWPEIWLNEGFATWTEWYFAEKHGGPSAQQVFVRQYRGHPASQAIFWNPPPGRLGQSPNRFAIESNSVYRRGAMTLQALRDKIGTQDLLRIMRTWATEHRHAHGDTEEFIALAERISGRPLRGFFHRWLFQQGKP